MVTILYALVASPEGVPLADVQAVPGVHASNAKKVLASIKRPFVERKCITYNGYSYDLLPHRDGTVYMCVTEESCSRVVSFRFLEATRRQCGPQRDNPVGLAAELKREVDLFNDVQRTKIREIRSEIDTVKEEMIANVDKLLSRGDQLDELLLQSSALEGESSTFRQNTRSIARSFFCCRIAMYVGIACGLMGLLFGVVLAVCSRDGVNFNKCRKH